MCGLSSFSSNLYNKDDIFNADETALLSKLILERFFIFKDKTYSEAKRVKQRLFVLLAVSIPKMEKLPLLIIRKSEKSLFQEIKMLTVIYKVNSRMPLGIFKE